MAANNYFGFAHGGTQYSAQPAGAYPTAQTAYVQPAQAAAFATAAPRAAQTYEPYPAAHTAGTYAYATRTAQLSNKIMVVMAPPPPPASTQTYVEPYYARATQPTAYDATKTYYQPAQATYTVATETPQYHAAKPVYTASTSYNTAAHARPAAAQKTPTVAVTTTPSTYVYQGSATTVSAPATTTYPATTAAAVAAASSSSYSGSYGNSIYGGNTTGLEKSGKKLKIPAVGYDAALYSAATTYYQQQQAAKTGTSWTYKKGVQQKKLPNKAPKGPQLHYCDVCKISCAGPQTYREHLEGQKHKKKEASMKTGTSTSSSSRGGQNQLRCELCDVSCTGADAYAAHIRGAKHQKVLKLHTKLGKPIPSTDPVVVTTASTTTTSKNSTSSMGGKSGSSLGATSTVTATKKVLATPKITFVGGTQLKTTGVKSDEIKAAAAVSAAAAVKDSVTDSADDKDDDDKPFPGEKDVQPVGHEYIEEVKNEMGKIISFNCKLCECKFNDPNAKEMHMKGRRHRLQYKKKVDPSLVVEVKPSIRARKLQEEKLKRQAQREEYWRRRDQEERWREEMSRMEEEMYWEERRRYEEEMEYMEWQRRTGGRGMPPRPFPPQPPMGMPMRKPDTSDDRHVMSKHASIYPNEAELQAVQNIVSSCEKALKLVSDFIAESEGPLDEDKKEVKEKVKEEVKPVEKESEKKDDSQFSGRTLKGVMRVGVLAKGLLLHGDLNVQLVVLCSEKPTRTLLERVADCVPKQLATVTDDKYEVKMCVEEAAVIVTSQKEPITSCTITVTSPIIRDENLPDGESVSVKDPPDVLDRQKCLRALAALRHAKWFQARANGLQSCVVVIRILRDLCQRVPTWAPLNQWGMELLVEKCVSSGGPNMSPGDALRRVFECIASGILLPGGPGLYDPCEKDPTDSAATLSSQEREDITASAQHALRLIAFRQIHKVLGMDPLPAPRFQRPRFNPRKRRRTNSTGEAGDEGGEKKDKKEGDSDTTEATSTGASTSTA